ncbi:hypothetical protein Tsubulata_027303, partial [Turnera subulata]
YLLAGNLAYSCTPFVILISVLVCAFFPSSNNAALITIPQNETIPAVIIFGDSIMDPGNNNNIKTIAKGNFPPYGRDFMGGKPTGRFCNGKIPSDFIAETLGIKQLLPPYLGQNLQLQELRTGVSFASGANGYDPLTAELSLVLSLSDQLDLFKEYLKKIRTAMGENAAATILSKGVYILCTGSDDIANTFPIRKLHYDINSYTDLMASYASSFIQDLYGVGVRRLGVVGLPPIGCLPSQRTVNGGIGRECSESSNQGARLFNSKLSSLIASLSQKFPDAIIVYADIYNVLLSLIQNPQHYGFEVSNKGCCGTGNIEVAFLCNRFDDAHSCKDASKYCLFGNLAYSCSFVILCVVLVCSFPANNAARITIPNNETIPAVIVFGDSIMDPGNNNDIKTIVKCNFPPYGRDFMEEKPTGRFCNGKIPSDIFVESLGIKQLLPAYLDQDLQLQDLLTGVSFASGAAGYDPLTAKVASSIRYQFIHRFNGKLCFKFLRGFEVSTKGCCGTGNIE